MSHKSARVVVRRVFSVSDRAQVFFLFLALPGSCLNCSPQPDDVECQPPVASYFSLHIIPESLGLTSCTSEWSHSIVENTGIEGQTRC